MIEARYSQISLGLITVVTLGPAVAFLIANYCVVAPWLPIVLGALMVALSLLPMLLLIGIGNIPLSRIMHPHRNASQYISTGTFYISIIVALPLGLAAAVLLLHNGPTHAALTIATTFVAYLTAMFTVLNLDNIPSQAIVNNQQYMTSEAKRILYLHKI
jgi:hypothetical protein